MKTFRQKSRYAIFTFFLMGCFLFLNSSCGLDEFYYVESPFSIKRPADPGVGSSIEYSENYFEFNTNETSMAAYINNSSSSFIFEGTEVYYKIYTKLDTWKSEWDTLYRLSSDTRNNNTTAAYLRLTDTTSSGYGYLPLSYDGKRSVFVPATGTNRTVYIRLTDYSETVNLDSKYASSVKIGSSEVGKPRRNNAVGNYSFNFGRSAEQDKVPVAEDPDTKYEDFSTDNIFYVSLYAVAKGHDTSYTQYYSNIVYLGTVTIDASSENN